MAYTDLMSVPFGMSSVISIIPLLSSEIPISFSEQHMPYDVYPASALGAISISPSLAVSKLMQQLKGRTAHAMINEFPLLRRQYWGRHMWARGYFCCSSGNVTDEVIKQYIAQQEDADETFRIEGE